jgi:hypothetical protein
MYESLAGVPPFDGENSIQIIVGHINQKPRPVSKLRPDFNISPVLENLIMRALEKDPAKRFQAVEELKAELERAQKERTHRWSTWFERLRPGHWLAEKKRNRGIRGQYVMAAASVLAAIGVLGSFYLNRCKIPSPNIDQAQTVPASRQVVLPTFKHYVDLAELARIRGDSEEMSSLYKKAIEMAEDADVTDQQKFDLCVRVTDALMRAVQLPTYHYLTGYNDTTDSKRARKIIALGQPFYEEALFLSRKNRVLGKFQAPIFANLAEIAHTNGDLKSEEKLLRESITASSLKKSRYNRGQCYIKLACIYIRQQRFNEAEEALKRAVHSSASGSDSLPDDAELKLAALYMKLGKPQFVEPIYRRLIVEQMKEKQVWALAANLPMWERLLRLSGKSGEANIVHSRIAKLKKDQPTYFSGDGDRYYLDSNWGHLIRDPLDPELELTAALAPMLQGATNGTIGPEDD